jgi:hypothetical protein
MGIVMFFDSLSRMAGWVEFVDYGLMPVTSVVNPLGMKWRIEDTGESACGLPYDPLLF